MARSQVRRRAVVLAALLGLGTATSASAGLPAAPEVQWSWHLPTTTYPYSVADTVPVVVQLTDDTGDGQVDASDSPDVVFLTSRDTDGSYTMILAVHGDTGGEIFRVQGRFGRLWGGNLTAPNLAAADLDGDGASEILVTDRTDLLIYRADGSLWRTVPWPPRPSSAGHAITIADLDQNGVVDVFTLAIAMSLDGAWSWTGTAGGFEGTQQSAISVATDLQPASPGLELFAGNTLYSATGAVLWQAPIPEGAVAIEDLDGDGAPELTVVAARQVHVLSDDGSLLAPPLDLGGDPFREAGAPLAADIDGDGRSEIVVNANQYPHRCVRPPRVQRVLQPEQGMLRRSARRSSDRWGAVVGPRRASKKRSGLDSRYLPSTRQLATRPFATCTPTRGSPSW